MIAGYDFSQRANSTAWKPHSWAAVIYRILDGNLRPVCLDYITFSPVKHIHIAGERCIAAPAFFVSGRKQVTVIVGCSLPKITMIFFANFYAGRKIETLRRIK